MPSEINTINKTKEITQNNIDNEEYERDYSKEDLVDLIEQPAWKTILIDLVKKNKMDPWDIDVSELTEKYLKKIEALESNCLKIPANAILACALLVKTKSKQLKLSSIEDEEEEKESTEEEKTQLIEDIPDLIGNRSLREGRISLDELVQSIEGIIQENKPKNNRKIERNEITLNFDEESIEEKIDDIYKKIKNKIDSQGVVLFDDIVEGNDAIAIVNAFMPVLFLMNDGKILAYQEEFFGDIFVKLVEAA